MIDVTHFTKNQMEVNLGRFSATHLSPVALAAVNMNGLANVATWEPYGSGFVAYSKSGIKSVMVTAADLEYVGNFWDHYCDQKARVVR